MGTKTIAIMDDAYELLKSVQKPGESFSAEIRRIVKEKGRISRFAGAWKDVSDKEIESIFKSINQARESTRKNWSNKQ